MNISPLLQRTPRTLLLAGVLGAAVLTGCGGGDDGDDGVASLNGSSAGADEPAAREEDAEQQLLDYVECLRGQGLDVPDPEFDKDGGGPRMMVRAERADGAKNSPQAFEKAREVCGDPPAPPGGGARLDDSEFQDAALEFARCMRAEGIDMPDPQFSSESGGGRVTFGAPGAGKFDPEDPKLEAARKKCEPIFEKARAGDDAE